MELRQLIQLVKRKKFSVLAAGGVAGAIIYLLGLFVMTYESKATIIIRPLGDQSQGYVGSPMLGMVYSPHLDVLRQESRSYITILKSRPLLLQVVEKLGLHKQYESAGAGAAVHKLMEAIKTPLRLLAYGRLPSKKRTPTEFALDKLERQVSVKILANSSIVEIEANSRSPKSSQAIANTLMEVFIEHSRRTSSEQGQQIVSFLEGHLQSVRDEIDAKNKELADLKMQHGIHAFIDIGAEIARKANQLRAFEDQREAGEIRLTETINRITVIEAVLSDRTEYQRSSYTIGANPAIDRLRDRLYSLMIERSRMAIDYQPGSVQAEAVNRQIELTEAAISNAVARTMTDETFNLDPHHEALIKEKILLEVERDVLPRAHQHLSEWIARYTARLSELDQANNSFMQLQKALTDLEATEAALLTDLHRAVTVRARGLDEVETVQPAEQPRYPKVRNMPLVAFAFMAFIGGLVISTSYEIYREIR